MTADAKLLADFEVWWKKYWVETPSVSPTYEARKAALAAWQERHAYVGEGMALVPVRMAWDASVSETRSSVPVGDIAYAIATDMVRYASTGAQQPAPAGFGPSSLCLARALIAALATPRLGTAALRWAVSTFGEVAEDKEERAMRCLEEAIEVANAVGLPPETLQMIGARGYSRQKGDRSREIGQAMLTLELLADVLTIDPQRAAADEFSRIQSIPKEEWERRHQAKVDMGIAK